MHTDQLVTYLDRPDKAADWLQSLGLGNLDRAHANLVKLARSGLTLDLVSEICGQLSAHLPRLSDADMALNNLERFLASMQGLPMPPPLA